MSTRAQRILLWWGLAWTLVYGLAWWRLLHMMPPPTARLTADEIARFYLDNGGEIKIGAMICGWTGGFMVPIAIVIAAQIARLEKGFPVWAAAAFAGGTLMSVPLVLPPIFWGTAAFTPTRAPEITAIMHELAMLTFVTTDQYYIFMWVAITAASLLPATARHSPFPRWFGYYTAWTALMFETGAVAFLTRSGPFAWNGLLAFWLPVVTFFVWIAVAATMLFRAIPAQENAYAGTFDLSEAI